MMLNTFTMQACQAMLNTLYPPAVDNPPSSKLTVNMLQKQRDGFFTYIRVVNRDGTGCLQNLIRQGCKANERNGWFAVKRTLNNYLNLASCIIEESQHISNICAMSMTPDLGPEERRNSNASNKTDSGVSFVEGKHSKNASTSSGKSSSSHISTMSMSSTSLKSQGSTLERIARELKRMRPRRIQADEMIDTKISTMPRSPDATSDSGNNTPASARSDKDSFVNKMPPTPTSPVPSSGPSSGRMKFGLRKMKSLGAIADLKHENLSSTSLRNGSMTPVFDVEEMQQRKREALSNARIQKLQKLDLI
jgi:hypothetical protein